MVLPEGIPLLPPTEVSDLHTVPWAWCTWGADHKIHGLLFVLLLQGSFSFLLLQWRAMFRGTTFRSGSLSSTRVWSSALRPISPPGLVLCLVEPNHWPSCMILLRVSVRVCFVFL